MILIITFGMLKIISGCPFWVKNNSLHLPCSAGVIGVVLGCGSSGHRGQQDTQAAVLCLVSGCLIISFIRGVQGSYTGTTAGYEF